MQLHNFWKELKIHYHEGSGDPKAHTTNFIFTIWRAQLDDGEKEAG